jgi:hypothetical protein
VEYLESKTIVVVCRDSSLGDEVIRVNNSAQARIQEVSR